MKKNKIITIIILLASFSTINAKTINNTTEEITTSTTKNCALLVAGGLDYDLLNTILKRSVEFAESVMKAKGWNVKTLKRPTLDDLEYNIQNWIPNNLGEKKQVLLYFTDHGDTEGRFILNSKEILNASKLNQLLDYMEPYYSICIVVINCCYAGSFIEKISKNNRIIITSTDGTNGAYSYGLTGLFSKPFFEALQENVSIGEAWEKADLFIDTQTLLWSTIWSEQNPQIDDNGNGYSVGNSEINTLPMNDGHTEEGENLDGVLAHNTKLEIIKSKPKTKNLNKITTADYLASFIEKQIKLSKFVRSILLSCIY